MVTEPVPPTRRDDAARALYELERTRWLRNNPTAEPMPPWETVTGPRRDFFYNTVDVIATVLRAFYGGDR